MTTLVARMENLHGKTAIITGGGSGIGKAIAVALLREGANVVIASRRGLTLENVVSVPCDVRKKSDVLNVVEVTKQRFGGIDILVNNTGLGVGSNIVDCSEEDWHKVLDTNLTGTFLMIQ